MKYIKTLIHFLFAPPELLNRYTKFNSINDIKEFRFWAKLNQNLIENNNYLTALIWLLLPNTLAYRLYVIPCYILNQFYRSCKVIFNQEAVMVKDDHNISRCYQFFDMNQLVLKYPGLSQADYYKFNLYLEENKIHADSLVNVSILFYFQNIILTTDHHKKYPNNVNNKLFFESFLNDRKYPSTNSIALLSDNKINWLSKSQQPSKLPKKDLILKPLSASHGAGISRIFYSKESQSYQIEEAPVPLNTLKNIKFKINYPADPISEENFILFLKHLSKKSKTIQWLVQERLFPHNKITHSFDTNTLTTLRIVTSYNRISKKSIFISAYCRIPLKDSAVDNIYLTNQFIGIDLKTGFLEDKQKSQYYNDHKDINHSRSGIPYKKIQIPYTQRIESACIRLHESLVKEPNIVPAPIIGFDIGITKNGYVFLEANAPCELIAEQEQYMAGPLLNNVSFVESLSSWFPFLDQLPIHPHFRIRQIKAALAANKDKDQ